MTLKRRLEKLEGKALIGDDECHTVLIIQTEQDRERWQQIKERIANGEIKGPKVVYHVPTTPTDGE
ncbi:MAG: hypothetical protein ACOWWM_04975 [Desulfobacterales bacterium]